MRLDLVFSDRSVTNAAVPLSRKKDRTRSRLPNVVEPWYLVQALKAKYRRGTRRTKWYTKVVCRSLLEVGGAVIQRLAPLNPDAARKENFLHVFFVINNSLLQSGRRL